MKDSMGFQFDPNHPGLNYQENIQAILANIVALNGKVPSVEYYEDERYVGFVIYYSQSNPYVSIAINDRDPAVVLRAWNKLVTGGVE